MNHGTVQSLPSAVDSARPGVVSVVWKLNSIDRTHTADVVNPEMEEASSHLNSTLDLREMDHHPIVRRSCESYRHNGVRDSSISEIHVETDHIYLEEPCS